jgi:hypothetical protein
MNDQSVLSNVSGYKSAKVQSTSTYFRYITIKLRSQA